MLASSIITVELDGLGGMWQALCRSRTQVDPLSRLCHVSGSELDADVVVDFRIIQELVYEQQRLCSLCLRGRVRLIVSQHGSATTESNQASAATRSPSLSGIFIIRIRLVRMAPPQTVLSSFEFPLSSNLPGAIPI